MATRRRPMRRLGDLLPELAGQLGLEQELRLARAMSSWDRLVGELVPAATGATWLLEVRPPTLIVAADDPATGQEIRLHSDELLAAFAGAPGGQRLLEIRVVVRSRERATRPPGGQGPPV